MSVSGGRARVDIWYNADPNAECALEARLDAAEKNIIRLRERLHEVDLEMEQKTQQQAEALKEEKQERANEDKNIRNSLETAQTRPLHISAMGVAWLVAGVVMSTVPSELACLAHFLFR